jgi:uncharacterized cofD-like protein
MKKIVTIGGGSGQFVLLSAIAELKDIEITSVVSVADSGGSSGELRDRLGVLPPGDILKCLLALSPFKETARQILQTRFSGDNRLKGHNAGNMLLSMFSEYAGFVEGVEALSEVLKITGRVFPVTTERATLVAELESGRMLFGESTIDLIKDGADSRISRVFLVPHHGKEIQRMSRY